MIASIESVLRFLLSVLGTAGVADVAVLGVTGALAVTLVAATVVLVTTVTLRLPVGADPSRPHPRRAIALSTFVAQSDPDAPGRPRPRAPQSVAPAT